jgi:hypothetical protein
MAEDQFCVIVAQLCGALLPQMELGSDVQRADGVHAEQQLVCLTNKAHHGADLRRALVPQLVVRAADLYLQSEAALVLVKA